MKSELRKLKEISCLESMYTSQDTIDAITEAVEGRSTSFGVFKTAEEAITAVMEDIDKEEANERN